MSAAARGRVLKEAAGAVPLSKVAAKLLTPSRVRIVAKVLADAKLEAEATVKRAKDQAAEIESKARAAAGNVHETVACEAREEEHAKLAAAWAALRAREERQAERDLDRAMELAAVLAERLLGGALELDPARIAALARQAIAEARGARRAVFDACPLDVDPLRRHLDEIGLPKEAVEVRPAEDLARGSLRVHTDLGTLDAQLSPQLQRLAAALRDALRS